MKNNFNLSIFSDLLRIRKVELTISREYKKGEMRCPVHLSIGQEATPVGICKNLSKKDQIVSTHRSHAHYLAKGGNLKKMMAEIYGKTSGCSKGKGGSMHLIDLNVGMVAAVPIVGSTIPIGTGLAWANKLEKNNKVVVVFLGDGATEEGVFFESLDFASLHNLKVIFVCENNFYSVYSPLKYRQSKKRNILSIVKSFGVKIFKKYSEDIDNSIRMIDMSFDKLKGKFEILDSLMLFINKYNNNEFENLLNDTTKIKINYSKDVYKNPNVIDFDSSLFITSDDIDIDSENSSNMNLTYHLSNKEKFIDEYSN